MEKIKQILHSHKKEEEPTTDSSGTTAKVDTENPQALVTDPEVAAHEHTVRDQILNPDHAKYNETQFGTTAHAAGDLDIASTGAAPLETVPADAVLQTNPGEKKHEHSILRQILNPGGNKYDSQAFGDNAHVVTGDAAAEALAESRPEDKKHEHGILRQIVNPGNDKYDSTAFGEPQSQTTAQPESGSNSLAKDAAIGGAAGGVFAGGALASHEHADRDTTIASSAPQVNKPVGANDVENATYTYSQTPVGIGASSVQATPSSIDNMHVQPVAAGTIDDTPSSGVRHGQAIHDAEAGAAAGIAGGAIASQINQPKADQEIANATHVDRSYPLAGSTADPTPGVIHHTLGPHPTDAGNKLDPEIAGVSVPKESLAEASSSATAPDATSSSTFAPGVTAGTLASTGLSSETGTTPSSAAPTTTAEDKSGSGPWLQSAVLGATAGRGSEKKETLTGTSSSTSAAPSVTTGAYGAEQDSTVQTTTNTLSSSTADAHAQPNAFTTADSTTIEPHATGQDPAVQTTTNTIGSSNAAHTQPNISTTTWQEPSGTVAKDHHLAKDAGEAGLVGAGAGAVYSELPHQSESHERKLQAAREERAAKGGDRGEKKESLIHKILHIGHKDKDHEKSVDHKEVGAKDATYTGTDPAALHAAQTAVAEHEHPSTTTGAGAVPSLDPVADKSTAVIEPRTGLPIDPVKYGTTGAGGTDGAPQIKGYHTADPAEIAAQTAYNPTVGLAGPLDKEGAAAAGPDWEAIKKANTPY